MVGLRTTFMSRYRSKCNVNKNNELLALSSKVYKTCVRIRVITRRKGILAAITQEGGNFLYALGEISDLNSQKQTQLGTVLKVRICFDTMNYRN